MERQRSFGKANGSGAMQTVMFDFMEKSFGALAYAE